LKDHKNLGKNTGVIVKTSDDTGRGIVAILVKEVLGELN
jgi:hypothetical protein